MEEIIEFRDVDGFPGYKVSSDGRVWSCWKNCGPRPRVLAEEIQRELKPSNHAHKKGDVNYRVVGLYRNGGSSTSMYVHRLVANAFLGECPENHECAHNDGNPFNNNVLNLRWATRQENVDDKHDHGTTLAGENHNLCKLKKEEAIGVYNCYHDNVPFKEICEKFGIRKTQVYQIGEKKRWASVLEELPERPLRKKRIFKNRQKSSIQLS